jgi:hypothetical protein
MYVAGGQHGSRTAIEVGGVETALDPALAAVQLAVYSRVHSKSLVTAGVRKGDDSSNTAETPMDFEFFHN